MKVRKLFSDITFPYQLIRSDSKVRLKALNQTRYNGCQLFTVVTSPGFYLFFLHRKPPPSPPPPNKLYWNAKRPIQRTIINLLLHSEYFKYSRIFHKAEELNHKKLSISMQNYKKKNFYLFTIIYRPLQFGKRKLN